MSDKSCIGQQGPDAPCVSGIATSSVFLKFYFIFSKNQILPYLHCFDCQEAETWPLGAHDGGMIQYRGRYELAQIFTVLEVGLRNSKS